MKKIRYKDKYIYVDDSPLDESETGRIYINTEEDSSKKNISDEDLLADTLTDLWSDDND